MEYIDLHMHTFYSDGTDDPKALVRSARLNGIDVMAITDHDIMTGYFDAKPEADKWGIKLIPGVEISTEKYHILGLNVNPSNENLQNFLAKVRSFQEATCIGRIEILARHGIPISLDKLKNSFPNSRLGKYNVFMTMMQDEECRNYLHKNHPNESPYEIFGIYLKKDGIAGTFNEKYDVPPREAIKAIHGAGGIAIIAHPFKNVDDMSEMDVLVNLGLDGVEIQPNYGDKNIPYRKYALENNLLMTYGSDFHGPSMPRPLLKRGENKVDTEKLLKGGSR